MSSYCTITSIEAKAGWNMSRERINTDISGIPMPHSTSITYAAQMHRISVAPLPATLQSRARPGMHKRPTLTYADPSGVVQLTVLRFSDRSFRFVSLASSSYPCFADRLESWASATTTYRRPPPILFPARLHPSTKPL